MRYSRTLIAAISTTLLVGIFAVVWPFVAQPGQPTFADVGQWLSGVLQPIAILWFLVALLEQQRELRRQGDELARQSRLHHTSVFMDFFKSYDEYTERAFREWMSRREPESAFDTRDEVLRRMRLLIERKRKPHIQEHFYPGGIPNPDIDPTALKALENTPHHFTYEYHPGAAELIQTLETQLAHLRQLAVLSNQPAAMDRLVDVSFPATVYAAAQAKLVEQQALSTPPSEPDIKALLEAKLESMSEGNAQE